MNCYNHPKTPASHTDSVPDATIPGLTPNEPGYRTVFLCAQCVALRARDVGNTARLQCIEEQIAVLAVSTLGQIAYEGYFNCSDGKSLITGAPLPAWNDQRDGIKAAWEAAAAAVLKAYYAE